MKSSRHSGGLGFSSPTARKIIALDGVNETSLEPKPDPKSMEVLPGNKVPISNPTATEAVGEVKVDTPMVEPKPDPKSMEVLPGNKVPISNPTATEAVVEVKVDTPMEVLPGNKVPISNPTATEAVVEVKVDTPMEVLPGNKVPISNPTATEAVVEVDTPMVKKDKRAKKVKGVTKFEQLDPKDDSVDLVVEGEGEHSTPKRTRLHLVIKRRKTSTEVAKKE
jgi:hypothetical protein